MNERVFFDRREPLGQMLERYREMKEGEFFVIYGRRRLGKSELANEFIRRSGGKHVTFFVNDSSKEDSLLHFERDVQLQLGVTKPIRSWDDLFEIIKEQCTERFIVVFDEVQRLLDIDRAFFSRLQHWWDSQLRTKPLCLVMIGSAIGMMKRAFLLGSSPLFQRKTWSYLIEPFLYADFREMFHDAAEEERVQLYAVFGGTPAYLHHVRKTQGSAMERIQRLCLAKGGPLADEPAELLRTELKRSERYNAILHGIASGRSEQKEIADIAGLKKPNHANPYLSTLQQELHLIRRADPVGGKKRQGRYGFQDPFFHFWYRYIHPLQSLIVAGNLKLAEQKIEEGLSSYTGRLFEQIVRELLIAYNGRSIAGIPLNLTELGSWWSRKGEAEGTPVEIDIVGLAPDYALLCEVEWSVRPAGPELVHSLLRKAQKFPLRFPHRYLLVTRAGFTKAAEEEMAACSCAGLTLADMERLFDQLQSGKPSKS